MHCEKARERERRDMRKATKEDFMVTSTRVREVEAWSKTGEDKRTREFGEGGYRRATPSRASRGEKKTSEDEERGLREGEIRRDRKRLRGR